MCYTSDSAANRAPGRVWRGSSCGGGAGELQEETDGPGGLEEPEETPGSLLGETADWGAGYLGEPGRQIILGSWSRGGPGEDLGDSLEAGDGSPASRLQHGELLRLETTAWGAPPASRLYSYVTTSIHGRRRGIWVRLDLLILIPLLLVVGLKGSLVRLW